MAPKNQQQEPAAAIICLPDFYADLPQSWLDCLDAMFTAAKITQPLTKFHWALAKLPVLLIATVRPLSRDPTAVGNPYKELQELLLHSYGLSAAQMTSRWLDYPMCGNTRPSVMWDNLTALQPATVKEAQTILFLRKLPRHIRNLINLRAFKEPEDLIQRCNEIWEDQTAEQSCNNRRPALAAAGIFQQEALQNQDKLFHLRPLTSRRPLRYKTLSFTAGGPPLPTADGSQTLDFPPPQSLTAYLWPPAAPPCIHFGIHQPACVCTRYV
jgi:hypothetical protein